MIKKVMILLITASFLIDATPNLSPKERGNALFITPPAAVIAGIFCGNFYQNRGPRLVSVLGLVATGVSSALFIKKI